MIVIQSMEKKEYYLRIAEIVFPELKTGRFFASVKSVEHYFSGLLSTEVKNIYKSFYDEFDFAFNIHCTFSLCDQKSEARWIRQEGSEHFYTTPMLFVVERTMMSNSPEQLIRKMLSRYCANTIILESYSHQNYNEQHLAESMRRSGLHLIWKRELEPETKSMPFLIKQEPQIHRLIVETKTTERLPLQLH